jgi:hypothetical protein
LLEQTATEAVSGLDLSLVESSVEFLALYLHLKSLRLFWEMINVSVFLDSWKRRRRIQR